jgi:type I restriction enzyme S subunit
MSLPRYSKYKDSGAKWLGVVPEHWEISVLKRMAHTELSNIDKKTAEGETSVRLCNYLDVYRNQTITANLDFMAASASVEQIARLSLRQGDVIITKDSETPDDIGIPALVAENMDGVVCGYHLALLRMYSRVADGSYMARALQSAFLHAQFSTSAVGITRFALGKYKIENAIVPKPTIEEQMEIAAFLDRETGKIDALVEEQRRLIELLKEKRQAVISHAVTKGLNPNVPMKDSGKDWIGEVPSHWEVLKFTREVKTVEGQVDPKVEPYSSMNLIGPEHVESKTGRLIELATDLALRTRIS